MFRFQFDLEDGEDESTFAQDLQDDDGAGSTRQEAGEPFSEIDLDSLLEALPTQISYSFVSTPAADGRAPDLKIARRDLFDARFQLISDGSTDDLESTRPNPQVASALEFIDNPSDLVPLVYEGGLKTWECSLDLASLLKRDGHAVGARGHRVLELGCGTAIPTLCVLGEIFSLTPADDAETHVHLQDYNTSVLHLVTAPNVLLAWYTSPAASAYRAAQARDADSADPELVIITPELLQAFKTSLRDHRVRLRFFSGAWDALDVRRTGGPYNLVLTSETIYHPSSLDSLVRVMRDACAGGHPHLCLVSGKTVYFGVGGGVAEFVRCVESVVDEEGNEGRVQVVWEKTTGVSRKVMRVEWARAR